ncbi:MAG: hypothetical protein ACYTFW_15095 [Planctomycetota bacterium]|jgi:hypothetical protein
MNSPKKTLFTAENAFSALKKGKHLLSSSAKKYEKLYLFMGPANKNVTTHTNKGHLRTVGGS